jgi:DNA mismatch repair ATPase MutS
MILSGIVKEVSVLRESINNLEGRENKAALNKALGSDLEGASKQIKDLDSLLGRFDYRLNPYIFIFLNAFLLWDLWQMHGLTHWKEQNRGKVAKWVHALATTEALSSLALLHFNHPEWCFPEISHQHFEFEATQLGHPLIPESKRVNNNFQTKGLGQLELVTGSNMAGKSTFLRTVGVNIVLAMAGSPVCAAKCRTSTAKVVSSMRIADNLEDSTSTFYAELKKLRSIIDMVKSKEHVFILLDEILRGTNSRDRLAGSKALVRQLIREKAVGIIATHDLELAQMEEEYPQNIHNYYFDVQFYGDQLGFDYTLRKGVCTTKNAELLMRQIGIEM